MPRNDVTSSVLDIECPDEHGFTDHFACDHYKLDQETGEWYCELHEGFEMKAEKEPEMRWE